MFSIRQERKGTMREDTNFYAALTIIKQFPLVLQGSLAVNIGLRPGSMLVLFPERGGAKEGDIEEADEEYSARVQRMRKIHMAREKKKNQRRSILPYGEDDVNTGEESPPARPSHPFHSSDSSYNFDDFLLPTSKRDEDEEPNRLSRGRGVSSTNQSDSIPPSVLRRQSTAARQSESSLKLRSLSIPNQLEQVEWSIAHQEALIRSIAEQRIKMIHSPEDDTVAKLQQVQFGKTTW
ncbi:hypothetical protein GN244_ATG07644 [Phytophthora infestans]|uniref:Uncharacterized protein n=1 Tax=Phytophthora infestans TaxID=4787 RepID=A0A833TC98_PHYIN|nr:hypothetical protein GN244_ATG07644 [Phytophthora infestans]